MVEKRQNKKSVFLVFLLITGITTVLAQENEDNLNGAVSYITGDNIYVRFENTKGIEDGDTLYIKEGNDLIPALIVTNHSSISCLCKPIGDKSFTVSALIVGLPKKSKKSPGLPGAQSENITGQKTGEPAIDATEKQKKKINEEKKEIISGRISATSYSNFSPSNKSESHRFRYTLLMNVLDDEESKLSAESYIAFTHKLNEWDVVQDNLNKALKIYNLSVKYNFNESTSLWAGRKINPKIANIGAVDGLQFQKQWNHLIVGGVAGARPDYYDYGLNPDLMEYGAYIGQDYKTNNGTIQSSLAFFEQRNRNNIDRRFAYFQHSNSAIKNTYFFASCEMDLFKLVDGEAKNTASLTSLYVSIRYRVSRNLSLFGSYDNRKNVIYYETFKNYADEVLQRASRQGVRLRINYRPIKYMNLSVNAGTRFTKDDPRQTRTLNGYATYTRIPFIKTSLTVSANVMQTSYLDGEVYGARLSKDIVNGKLFLSLNYRQVYFDYVNTVTSLKQKIYEADLSWQFNKKLSLSVNSETTNQENENYYRFYLNLRQKF